MFQLALRMWTGTEMIYPTKFSVMFNPTDKTSSVRAFIKNDKIIVYDYMLITPFNAFSGPVFEQDIINVDGDEENLRIVEFSLTKGAYIARSIKNGDEIIMDSSHKYDIVGNTYEDKDLLGEMNESENKKDEKIKETSKIEEDKNNLALERKEFDKKDAIEEKSNVNEENAILENSKEETDITSSISDLENPISILTKEESDKTVFDKPLEEKQDKNIETVDVVENIELVETTEEKSKEWVIVASEGELNQENEIKDIDTSQSEISQENSLPETENIDIINDIPENHEETAVVDVVEEHIEIDKSESVAEPTLESMEEKYIYKKSDSKKRKLDIHFSSVCPVSKGGYSFTFVCGKEKDTYKGSEENTNAKKVDLSGIIAALEMIEGKFEVRIFTNSQYVVYPFFKGWIHKWKNSNWYKNEVDRIQNYELWEQLYEYSEKYNIKWEFVQTPTEEMEECHKFAEEEAK